MSELEEEDFATMFEASTRAKGVAKGQIIDGTIVSIGAEVALVGVAARARPRSTSVN